MLIDQTNIEPELLAMALPVIVKFRSEYFQKKIIFFLKKNYYSLLDILCYQAVTF